MSYVSNVSETADKFFRRSAPVAVESVKLRGCDGNPCSLPIGTSASVPQVHALGVDLESFLTVMPHNIHAHHAAHLPKTRCNTPYSSVLLGVLQLGGHRPGFIVMALRPSDLQAQGYPPAYLGRLAS